MNFNVYLDEKASQRLDAPAARRQTTRNALIRQAVDALVKQEANGQWPPEVLQLEGMSAAPAFEAMRTKLKLPSLTRWSEVLAGHMRISDFA